jgi:type I restriction enzyme S subunit
MEMDDLPKGWIKTKLPEIADIIMGQSPPSSTYNIKGEGLPFFQGKAEFGSLYPKEIKYCVKPQKIAEAGDILISVRAPVGPTNLCKEKSCIGRGLAALRARKTTISKYLLYYFRNIESWLSSQGTGSTFTAISKSDLEDIDVLIAPLFEQHRIVAKLEKLLAKVEACQERLDKIPAILKRFRQSVLASACSGRLTADWREENCVDDEWPVQPLRKIFNMRNGKSLTAIKRKHGDILVYGGNGFMGMHNKANTEGQVIVIGRVGAQCGNVHYVSGKVWVTDNAISLQAQNDVIPAFYAFFLRSQNLNQLSGGTGQPYVSQEILAPLETPVVSITEQYEIVRRVEALFKIADQIEERYKKAKAYIDKLTQSILAKAFRGELVPHYPNDEPASELLTKIKDKRDNSEGGKKI